MKIWQVTRDYFDGDHDHGYYDYGLYETEELARKAAEKVAENLVVEYNEWVKSNAELNRNWHTNSAYWEWDEEYPNVIEILFCGEWKYISVVEKEVLTEVREGIEKTMPTITYT